jgi:uncharacterized SAM-binding protein YcdF (DUF218 family)
MDQLHVPCGTAIVGVRPRFGRLLLSGFLFLVALQATNQEAVTGAFAAALESAFPRATIGEGEPFAGIVVLGGGEERLREAGRLARAYGHFRLFVSGAGDIDRIQGQLGDDIGSDRIELENRSRTTFENALFAKAGVQPRAGERWLLVTSATHMPRAISAFRGVGFDVEPWPVRDLPADANGVASVLQHEALGLLWYRLLGRTDALFPVP